MDIIDLRPDLRVLTSPPGQAYLLRHAGGVLLVDTGQVGDGSTIATALRDWGLDREALTQVVLTHWHADHTGALSEVAQWPNVEVLAHHGDAAVIRGHQSTEESLLTPAEEALHARVADAVPEAPPARVDHEVHDGELLEGIDARVISTPGHTPGSIALHLEEAGVLFTGDIAAEYERQIVLGPFNNDRVQARRSFRRLAGLRCDVVCFGHGHPLVGEATTTLHEAATARSVPDPLG
ncbi:MBL fold metallo-hydrolase [Actinopolyspora sp. H202]|uniref:MBL fold metallo-hydrolase n=1 Tax=Actinopolyspora sp. H202 TaxID=1500456 RepID=UPI003EE65C85